MLSNFIVPMKCRASKKRHEGQRSHRESDQRHDVLISDNPNDLSRSIIDREDAECATEFSIEETRCVLQGGLPMPQIGPTGRVGSSYKTRSQTPLPVTSLDTKTHQPSFFGSHKNHFTLPAPPLDGSSRRIEIPVDSSWSNWSFPRPNTQRVTQWYRRRRFSRYFCCSWLRTVSPCIYFSFYFFYSSPSSSASFSSFIHVPPRVYLLHLSSRTVAPSGLFLVVFLPRCLPRGCNRIR